MSKAGTFLRRCDELLLWSQLGLKSQQNHIQKPFKNVWQVELVIGFQDLDFCGGMHLCIFHHLPCFFAFCSFTSVWRGAMLEEIPKPMFSFKADTWRHYRNTFTSRGTARQRNGTCVERSSPKRRCSLFRSSISWTKRSFQEVCPGLCQEIGDSIFSRLNRLFQIVLA